MAFGARRAGQTEEDELYDDDYAIHQTSLPLTIPATSDRNFYHRFRLRGFVGDGSLYFSAAMGFYPNRGVYDGGFSVLVDGHQYCLHLSDNLPIDRAHTTLGAAAHRNCSPDAPASRYRERA